MNLEERRDGVERAGKSGERGELSSVFNVWEKNFKKQNLAMCL